MTLLFLAILGSEGGVSGVAAAKPEAMGESRTAAEVLGTEEASDP